MRLVVVPVAVALGCASHPVAPPPAATLPSSPPSRPCALGTAIPTDRTSTVAPPPLCITHATLSRKGTRQYGRWTNDDRARVAHGGLLLVVADTSNPGNPGGDFDPIAIDAGFDAIELAVRPAMKTAPCTEACVGAAFEAANAAMYAIQAAFNPIFEEELAKIPTPLSESDRREAEWRAWERVARARVGRVDIHQPTVAASVSALIFDGGGATVGQIGTSRAYRCRGGGVEQLLPDQSLSPQAPVLACCGNPSYGLASARLGAGPVAAVLTRTVDVQSADRFLLVTDGVWTAASDADLARACKLTSAREIAAAIDRVAHDAADDVTILVAAISAAR